MSRPSRRPNRRALAIAAVLGVILAGAVPGVAHADAPVLGGPTPAVAVPLPVTDLSGSFVGSNEGITSTGTRSTQPYWYNTAWYSFTPAASGLLTVTTSDISYDTTLELWTAAGGFVTQDDDYSTGVASQIAVLVTAGTEYRLGLGSYGYEYDGATYSYHGTATVDVSLLLPPSPPLSVQAQWGDETAAVSWTAPSDPVDSYTVWCQPEYSSASACGETTETSLTLTDLDNGTPYAIWVTATNAAGTSGPSTAATVTPKQTSMIVITTDPASPVSGEPVTYRFAVVSRGVEVTTGSFTLATIPGSYYYGFPPPLVMHTDAAVAGDHTVTADYSGTDTIAPSSGSLIVSVARRPQTVTFPALPTDLVFAGAPVTLAASSSEGLPITYSASGACTATGDQLSLTGVGECTVEATQAGNSQVLPASPVTQGTTVAKRPQTLSVSGLPPVIIGPGQHTVAATSDVGLPVTLTASGACTLAGSVVSIVDVGTCTITGSQAGDEHTLPGTTTVTATVYGPPATASLRIGFSVGDSVAGSPVTVTGAGLRPGTELTLTVYSTPTALASTAASVSGAAVSAGELPTLEPGEHRVVARGTALDGSQVSKVVRFAVDDGIVTRIGAPAALSATGATPDTAGLLALGWLIVGAGLIAVRRTVRRRTT